MDATGYAQAVIDQARKEWGDRKGSFTNLLRDSKARQEARIEYEASLEEAEYSTEETKKIMSSVNATHYLDIIAGADPSSVGIGGVAENQRIGPMWTQNGRVEALRQEAARMRAAGQAEKLMQVTLRICGEKYPSERFADAG